MDASVVDLPEPVVPVHHRRQIQLFDGANLGGNNAQHHAHIAALLKDVDAEAPQAGHAIGHVQLGRLLELLLLAVGHHAEGHGEHLFRSDAGHLGLADEGAINAHVGMITDLQMEVRGLLFYGATQQFINAGWHTRHHSRGRSPSKTSIRHRSLQAEERGRLLLS
jgi:hypothetical protein